MNRNDIQKAIESGKTALGVEFGSIFRKWAHDEDAVAPDAELPVGGFDCQL